MAHVIGDRIHFTGTCACDRRLVATGGAPASSHARQRRHARSRAAAADRRAGRPSAGRARARGRAPPWCGRGPASSSSTQVRSTEAKSSARPWARTMPRGPAASMSGRGQHPLLRAHRQPVERQREPRIARGRAHQRAHRRLVRRKRLEPAHQHVEQPLARRLLGHVGVAAGQHRAVDLLDVSGEDREHRAEFVAQSASETPARAAISAKPISSNGFSASSAMNASMILRSRGGRSRRRLGRGRDGGFAAVRGGLLRLAAPRRRIRHLFAVGPPGAQLESAQRRRFQRAASRRRGSTGEFARPPASRPRPPAPSAGRGRRRAISTSSAAAVVPPGEVTFWRSVAASSGSGAAARRSPPRSRAPAAPRGRPAGPPRCRRAPGSRRAGTHRPGPSRRPR